MRVASNIQSIGRTQAAWILLLVVVAGCADDRDRAGATARDSAPPNPVRLVEIDLARMDSVTVEGEVVALKEWLGGLRWFAKEPTPVLIRVFGSDTTRMGLLPAVQDRLGEAGIVDVAYRSGAPGELGCHLLDREGWTSQVNPAHLAVLGIEPSGAYTLDGDPILLEGVGPAIQERQANDSLLVVRLEPDPASPYGAFLTLLTETKAAGTKRIWVREPRR